jgi:hypothetical protein
VTTYSTASKTFSLGCFFQRKPARPAGQKQHIGFAQRTLSVAPWNLLDHDRLTAGAIDTPHRIEQKDQKTPERNELKTALGELIVSGGRPMAARTNRRRTLARTHRNLNTPVIQTETSLMINESRKMVTTI